MTLCTTFVTVVAMLLQFLSHFLPNSELKDAGLGWWRLKSKHDNDDSWFVPVVHTIAFISDVIAMKAWLEYSGDDCREYRNRRSAKQAKVLSRVFGGISAFMKGCGCGVRFCYPKPGMVWCCVTSAASLVFTLISTCSSATEEYDPRRHKNQHHLLF
ncbi:hypothetical protein V1264_005772 [Littorina saxatilis]|uniref:Uncharacterized protein n=1 Tax=Littorina saxatilis TaxID=31220 RepID=A0AAN9B0E1_9CAEN